MGVLLWECFCGSAFEGVLLWGLSSGGCVVEVVLWGSFEAEEEEREGGWGGGNARFPARRLQTDSGGLQPEAGRRGGR